MTGRFRILLSASIGMCLLTLATACSGGGGGGGSGGTLPGGTATAVPTATPVPTPTPVPTFVSETSTAADGFVSSMGINTHIDEGGSTPYQETSLSQISALLKNLQIRHVRDEAYPAGSSQICSDDQSVASAGIDFDFVTAVTLAQSDLQAWAACTAGFDAAFEGPDEYDITHPSSDNDWPATIQAYTQALWNFGQSQSPKLAIIAPSFTTQQAYQMVGNLAPYMTYGNMHQGYAGYNPGTTGYGANGYGSIAYNLGLAAIVDGTQPVWATEVPYSTAGGANSVSLPVQAKYAPRLYLELYRAGVPRSYYFELADESSSSSGQQDGLVTYGLTPKPAYTALQQLISVLADPGPSFTPPSLQYSISGSVQNVHHLLLSRRDGTFDIVYWIEAESWNPVSLQTITVQPQPISFNFPVAPSSLTNYTYDTSTNSTFTQTSVAPAQYVTLYATDDAAILHVVPATSNPAARARRS